MLKKLILCIFLCATTNLVSAEWPTHDITIILPFVPGGMSDYITRDLAVYIEKKTGQHVIIKNLPGGDTIVGQNYILEQKNNNHTFIFLTEAGVISADSRGNKKLKTTNVILKYPCVLFGGPNSSVDKFKKQVEQGETINVGVVGLSSNYVLWANQLSNTKLKFNFITYKGVGQMVPDLIGGTLEYAFSVYSPVWQPLVDNGNLKPIMSSNDRLNSLNIVPYKNFGFLGKPTEGFLSFATGPDTSAEAIEKFSNLVKQNSATSNKIQDLKKVGMEVINLSGTTADNFVDIYLKKIKNIE